MSSYLIDNLRSLKDQHYIRKATSYNYWFDFNINKLRRYQNKLGESFCLVINGSVEENNAYVMPFNEVKELFKDTDLDPDRSGWSGTIINNVMRVRGRSLSVSPYYNAFHLLEEVGAPPISSDYEPEVIDGTIDNIELSNIKEFINRFNEQYRNAAPRKRVAISERIARPGAITDYLKRMRNFTCQLCNEIGFEKLNGTRYIEAHHIIELHKLLPSSYCSDNIVIACPTCHKKLHYANITYRSIDKHHVTITINGEDYDVERNLIS